MIDSEFFRHLKSKRIVVMGLGLHGGGLATTRWLLRRGARVLVTDLKDVKKLAPSLKRLGRPKRLTLILGRHRHADFRSADLIVANPDVPRTSSYLTTARRAGVPIVNEATIFFALCPSRIVGVTGTRGKSTVASLAAHCLQGSFRHVVLAGNIRTTPMLSILDRLTPSSFVVVELSSWQLEGLPQIRRSPDIAVLTNLYDDHANRYPSREAYFRAKETIWRYQNRLDVAILNRDNPSVRKRGKLVPGRRIWFSLHSVPEENAVFVANGWFVARRGGKETRIAKCTDLRLPGDHNVANALAAIAVARTLGVPAARLRAALRSFRGVPGRLQHIRTIRGVAYYNDTTATSPDGVMAALKSFRRPIVLIAGGVDKNFAPETYRALARSIRRSVKTLVLLPGTASDRLRRALSRRMSLVEAPTLAFAVQSASCIARSGSIVLLSPGAASFNLFLHEFDRGEQFVRAVRRLK